MAHDGHGELGHILPKKTYFTTFAALIVLTVVTVVVAKFEAFDFGNFNLVLAMLIASVKAALVMLFSMHAKYENPVLWTYIAIPLITLALMFFGIFIDNPYRVDTHPFPETAKELEPARPGPSKPGVARPESESVGTRDDEHGHGH